MMKTILDSRTMLIMICLAAATVLYAEPGRAAIVIGVNDYRYLSDIRAGVNDSFSMAEYLQNAGFDTVILLNDRTADGKLKRDEIESAFETITFDAGDDHPIDELVFFFAGHGVQSDGMNYLCLPGAELGTGTEMINIDSELIPWIRRTGSHVAMVFLDACRENILPTRSPGIIQGVDMKASRPVPAGPDLFILYAAQPGGISYEAPDGSNGFFTQTLLEALRTEDATLSELIEYMNRRLPEKSMAAYGKTQYPSIGGDFRSGLTFSWRPGASGKVVYGGMGELLVYTEPPGADVALNGRLAGISPLFVSGLTPGTLIVSAWKGDLYAEDEVRVKTNGLVTVSYRLAERSGTVFFKTDMTDLSWSLDYGEFEPVPENFLVGIPIGRRFLRLRSGTDKLWEGEVESVPGRTIQVVPEFRPAGSLEVRLPEHAQVLIQEIDGPAELLLSESALIACFPSGLFRMTSGGSTYIAWSGDFYLNPGQCLPVRPELVPTNDWGEVLLLKSLNDELEKAKLARSRLNSSGWIFTAGALAFAVLTGLSFTDYFSARAQYDSGAYGDDFRALRNHVLNARSASIFLAIGTGCFAAVGTGMFLAGPSPESLERRISDLKTDLQDNPFYQEHTE